MPLPAINIQLVDPGSAAIPVDTSQQPVYVGVADKGPLAEVLTFGNAGAVVDTYGHGHLVDVLLAAFANGAASVKASRIDQTVAGAVVPPDESPEGALIIDSVTGTPLQYLAVRIETLVGDGSTPISSGTIRVRFSLDAYDIPFVEPQFSLPVTLPASGQLSLPGTGLTVNFDPAAEPEAGDLAEFTTYAGYYTATEIADMTDALRANQSFPRTYAVYTGDAETASAANSVALAIETQIQQMFAEARFMGALSGASHDVDTAVITATAATAIEPPFLSLGYGAAFVTNARGEVGRAMISLREHEVAAMRISRSLISTDPGRAASGPLRRVVSTDYDAAFEGPALHDNRISTLRTWEPASAGVFIARQRMLVQQASNFRSWQHAAVMIVALYATHRIGFQLVLETLRKLENGTIDSRDAADIEGAVRAELERVLVSTLNVRGLPGHVSAIGVTVDRTVLLPKVRITIKIRSLEWAEDLDFTLEYADAV